MSSALGNCRLFTTEAVLTEFLNALADKGPLVRAAKGYSLTDCGSMLLMRERRLSEALTTDRHFEQEGFVALLRTP